MRIDHLHLEDEVEEALERILEKQKMNKWTVLIPKQNHLNTLIKSQNQKPNTLKKKL